MHGRPSDNPQQEPGGAGQLEAEVAPSVDGGERGGGTSLERQLEERIRAFVQSELGATQASRAAAQKARRRMRKGGRRGRR